MCVEEPLYENNHFQASNRREFREKSKSGNGYDVNIMQEANDDDDE